ncbi:hypothetical protein JCM10213_002411 [Rhodosporidiobolus nylandii]
MSTSSSYSSLLRRSKLATFNPAVDQVYSSSAAHLARNNYGFKRPLPAHSTKSSPFVRLSQLDSQEGRTVFRKATRETRFVKQWAETGVGIQSEAFAPRHAGARRWDRLELQSRFVDGAGPGAVKSVEQQADSGTRGVPRLPNVFALGEREFERFLEELGERRDEFKQFVVDETNRTSSSGAQPASVDDFDLYDHAQRHPMELMRLVERFLRVQSSSLPTASSLTRAPLPQVHPTLALQYASPTPLESALAPPVKGRLLGASPESEKRNGAPLYMTSHKDQFASILSTVSVVPGSAVNGGSSTTFFPDAAGVRSNEPGRQSFRLNPTINPVHYALRQGVEQSQLGRKSYDIRPPTAEYEPATLALRALELRPAVVPGHETPAQLPGTPEYSGNLPPELHRRGSGAKGAKAGSLSELWAGSSAAQLRSAGLGKGKTHPRDLGAGRRNSRTREQQQQWLRTRDGLLEERAGDARTFGLQQGARKGQQGQQKGRKGAQQRAVLDRLEALLKK